jgi:hypothetical protein
LNDPFQNMKNQQMHHFVARSFSLLLLASALFTACKKDDVSPSTPPAPTNEEELITTVILRMVDNGDGSLKEFEYRDAEGPGGNDPIITADTLAQGRSYAMTVLLLNESTSPVDTVSNEVLDEAEEHQFFFQVSGADLTVTYNDSDGNGAPIGLSNTALTGAASTGSLRVILRHEPDKSAAGVSTGDITNAGGETDVEVDLPVVIE